MNSGLGLGSEEQLDWNPQKWEKLNDMAGCKDQKGSEQVGATASSSLQLDLLLKETNRNAFWRCPPMKACKWEMRGSRIQCRQCEICVLLLFISFHGTKVGRISNTARELHFKKTFLPIMLNMD